MAEHYVPCMVAADKSYVAQARRAGLLDGFHGYREQNHKGKSPKEQEAYKKGFAEGREKRV